MFVPKVSALNHRITVPYESQKNWVIRPPGELKDISQCCSSGPVISCSVDFSIYFSCFDSCFFLLSAHDFC